MGGNGGEARYSILGPVEGRRGAAGAWTWFAERWRPFPWFSDRATIAWTILFAIVAIVAMPFGVWSWVFALAVVGLTLACVPTRRRQQGSKSDADP